MSASRNRSSRARRVSASAIPAVAVKPGSALRRRWVNSSAPQARASGRMTANSSPPIRYAQSVPRIVARRPSASARMRSSPAWWPSVSLTVLRSSRSTSTSASGTPVRATRCSSRPRSSWKVAVVAQAGERIGARHLGQPRQLVRARGVEPAAVAAQHHRERAEDEDRERDRADAAADDAPLGRVRGRRSARARGVTATSVAAARDPLLERLGLLARLRRRRRVFSASTLHAVRRYALCSRCSASTTGRCDGSSDDHALERPTEPLRGLGVVAAARTR